MKFKVRYVVIPFVCVLAAPVVLIAALHFKRITLVQDYINTLQSCAREGDILCRLGDRTWSLYFKGLSKEDKRFSHLGVVHISDNGITVINAEGLAWKGKDFVNAVPLGEFVRPARMLGLYRLNGVDGEKIAEEAQAMIGKPFDWDFNLNNADKVYCTELLYVVLKKLAPEIALPTVAIFGRDIVPLEAVSASPLFTEVLFLE
ncbi:MAG: hypothetical protein LBQ35_08505 [Spirochaetaceae bacterium]|jgi:hypothetical protein|nr:hypothetical protein [Spirochaetaceae bacterium]